MNRHMFACVVALIALAASGASVASAVTPEWGKCVKTALGAGKFQNSGCYEGAKEGGGEYEWESLSILGIKIKWTGKDEETIEKTETNGSTTKSCKKSAAKLEVDAIAVNPNIKVVTFTECTAPALEGATCNSEGQPSGTVIWKEPLSTHLGLTKANLESHAKDKWGVSVSGKEGGVIAEYACGPVPVIEKGGAIGSLTPLNKMTSRFKLVFLPKKKRQWPPHFPGPTFPEPEFPGEECCLEASFGGGPFEEETLTAKEVLTTEGKQKFELRTAL
jgi:hypothetical protein